MANIQIQTAGHGGLLANDQASLMAVNTTGVVGSVGGTQRFGWTMNGVAIEVVVKNGCTYVNGDLVHVVKK
jgi:hypothetical protein